MKSLRACAATTVSACALAAGLLLSVSASAEDLVWTTGKVIGADGKPVVGAIVAAYDDSNKVVDYSHTDRNGDYALAVPKHVLHIDKHERGFFATVMGTAERFGGDTVGFVTNPVRQGVRAVTAAEADSFTDPVTKGSVAAGGVVVDQVLGMLTPHSHRQKPTADRKQPGAVMMKVVARDSNDLVDVGRVYWIQEEELHAGGTTKKTTAAWLDPVKMAKSGTDTPSKVDSEYLKFTRVRLDPSFAEHGQIVHLSTRLVIPPDPHVDVVVVARNSRTGELWELHSSQQDVYETDITVDKKFPINDQAIEILAYAALTERPGRRHEVEKAIDGAGMWDPLKPFVYNPLLVVSRNRGHVLLTVVQPEKRKR